jgi:hypothetical protein
VGARRRQAGGGEVAATVTTVTRAADQTGDGHLPAKEGSSGVPGGPEAPTGGSQRSAGTGHLGEGAPRSAGARNALRARPVPPNTPGR